MKHTDGVMTGREQRAVFWRLLRYAGPHKKRFMLALAIMMVAAGAELLQPILIARFIDDYLTPQLFELKPLLTLAVLYVGLLIAAVIGQYVQSVLFGELR